MEFTAGQIAALIDGKIIGNSEEPISTFAKIEEGFRGAISFLANPKYESFIYDTESSAIIVGNDFIPTKNISATLIKVQDPYAAFSALLGEYQKTLNQKKQGIHSSAIVENPELLETTVSIDAQSYIGKNTSIGAYSQICKQVHIAENVIIGQNCNIHAGVKIYPNTTIGHNVIIKSNAVIGGPGFGFAPQADGTYIAVPQLGNVIIGNNVNIGANTTIDCATMGSTIIGDGVKIDNLVQIAHNVTVGENTVIVSQAGIAGSTKIGKNCVLGGQVGVGGHLTIADGTKAGGQSGLTKSIKKPNTSVNGTPAFDYTENLKSWAIFKKLPELYKLVDSFSKKQ